MSNADNWPQDPPTSPAGGLALPPPAPGPGEPVPVPDPAPVDDVFAEMEALLGAKEALTASETISLKPHLTEVRDRAEAALTTAERDLTRRPEDPEVAARVEAARDDRDAAVAEAAEWSREFRFKAIGRKAVEDMMAANRPTKTQVAEFRAELIRQGMPQQPLPYNPDEFPPKLMAAASVSPRMTYDQAIRMWTSDVWSKGELARLWACCWSVNEIVL